MIRRLHVAIALATAAAALTVVLSVPMTMAVLLISILTPYGSASAFDVIGPALLFAILGVPGAIAAKVVRRRHPDGHVLRTWPVLLATAAGVTAAIVGLHGPYLSVHTNHMSMAMRAAQATADPFVRIFWHRDVTPLAAIAAGAAAGAACGARATTRA